MFAIVDIETTGGRPQDGGITEIAVIIHDGAQVVETYETLINPRQNIPSYITGLTGIDNEMVKQAPLFEEIAPELNRLLSNRIFVAHNVNFDHSFLKQNFEELGFPFSPKKLCTVKWARKVIPGLKSYSLGRLCSDLNIEIENRHRAMGDAMATAKLLKMLFEQDQTGHWQQMSKANTGVYLPPLIDQEKIQSLPEATGIYFFHDERGKIIYVGKAKSIRSRVRSHFTGKDGQKKQDLRRKIANISVEITGSELLASLHEAAQIKKHFPEFNKAQKFPDPKFGIYKWIDQLGFERLSLSKVAKNMKPIASFTSLTEMRSIVGKASLELQLCPRLCGMEVKEGLCSLHQGNCPKLCTNNEHTIDHNQRLNSFIANKFYTNENEVFIDKGRTDNESSFVLFLNGLYAGFGYFESQQFGTDLSLFQHHLLPQKEDTEIKRILKFYRQIWPEKKRFLLT